MSDRRSEVSIIIKEQVKLCEKLICEGKIDGVLDVIKNMIDTRSDREHDAIYITKRVITSLINGNSDLTTLFSLLNKITDLSQNPSYQELRQTRQQYVKLIDNCLENDISQFNNLFHMVMERMSLQEVADSFSTVDRGKFYDYSYLMKGLYLLESNCREAFTVQLLISACKHKNIFLLDAIKKYFPNNYASFEQANVEYRWLFLILKELEKISNEENRKFMMIRISQFVLGFGQINYNGGALALAAFAHTKPHLNPTLLADDEHSAYFQFIANQLNRLVPLRERFVLTAHHWMCGEIQIDAQGHTSILFIDTLGEERDIDILKILIEKCSQFFPRCSIYLAAEKRMHTSLGCSVFALDDVIHLFSSDNFLDKSKYPNGLFDFLSQHVQEKIEISNVKVNIASLPLHLLRTMQSTNLLEIMKKSSDNQLLLNKKGITPQLFSSNQVGFIFRNTGKGLKLQNTRLEDKLTKMTNKILQFVTTTEFDTVQTKILACLLEGFKTRINNLILEANTKKLQLG